MKHASCTNGARGSKAGVQVRDAGILLSGAKFTLQTVDIDDIVVQYEDVADAITHLRVRSHGMHACIAIVSRTRLSLSPLQRFVQ